MLKSVGNKSDSLDAEPLESVVNLRAFRNKFIKYYVGKGSLLALEEQSALLLYFSLSFIDKKVSVSKLFGMNSLANKKLFELTDKELVYLGELFVSLLIEFLPAKLKHLMPLPGLNSWSKAKEFFEEQANSLLFLDIANLGFVFQILGSVDRKKNALPALQKANKKISKEELIAFTQLYTPGWVVDFLNANTVLSSHDGKIISQRYSRWLLPQNIEASENKIALEDFTLIDPACGAGQFLFSAFDLFSELYEQSGYEKETSVKLILSKNIFAADIDERALWVTGLGLMSQCLVHSGKIASIPNSLSNLALVSAKDLEENIDESTFLGSIDNRLSPNHFLKNKYAAIVTNPPYVGRRCLSREMKRVLKEQYPKNSADLSAAFLERCLFMLLSEGRLGIITQSSFMSIPSYLELRNYVLSNYQMTAAIKCGPGVFPLASGEKIDSILMLLRGKISSVENIKENTYFVDLSKTKNKALELKTALQVDDLSVVNQSKLIHGLPNNLLSQLSSQFYSNLDNLPKLGDIAEIRQGLATTDNSRFVRYYFDVDESLLGKTWIRYVKGAGGQRYVCDNPFVVKWEDNGREIKEAVSKAYPYLKGKTAWVVKNEEFYFRSGLCFSFINKDGLAVRRLPAGAIFDVASSAIFAAPAEEDFLLAYLNSSFIGALAKLINQTINIQVGDLKKLPIAELTVKSKNEISQLGKEAFQAKSALINCSFDLVGSNAEKVSTQELVSNFEKIYRTQIKLHQTMSDVQAKIDSTVLAAFENSRLINLADRQLLKGLSEQNEQLVFSARECAFKMFNVLVSNVVSNNSGDKIVLASLGNKKCLSEVFNLTIEGLDFLEQKLEIPIEKLLSRRKIVPISKLAKELNRYFSFYLSDYNSCMFFSSAAVRQCKGKFLRENCIVSTDLSSNEELLNKLSAIWSSVFEKLAHIKDWTSKDLAFIFDSIAI